jgi:hypothetical protein
MQGVSDIIPAESIDDAEAAVIDLALRRLNSAGQEQAFQTLTSLQTDIQTNPNLKQKLGQVAQLYQSGNDLSATQASESIDRQIAAGTTLRSSFYRCPCHANLKNES